MDNVSLNLCQRLANEILLLFCRWFQHITDATEAYKTREGRNRRPDASGSGSVVAPLPSTSSPSTPLSVDNPEKPKE